MHVSRGKDANPQPTTRDIFTGEVHQHPYFSPDQAKQLRLNLVSFKPGGRTKWHTHTYEQGLVILDGKGIVATEAHEHVVEAGDVVIIPPEEKHWHGGTESTGMSHISINSEGETTVLEPVEEVRTKDV